MNKLYRFEKVLFIEAGVAMLATLALYLWAHLLLAIFIEAEVAFVFVLAMYLLVRKSILKKVDQQQNK